LVHPSRLFLYKVARQLSYLTGDSGVSFRPVFKALLRFGAPPEEYWPYNGKLVDQPLDASLFGYHDGLQGAHYVRLDSPGVTTNEVLESLLRSLRAGFPCVLGFPVLGSVDENKYIPLPSSTDRVVGGQAVLAIGFDSGDHYRSATRGHLVFRNSWGPSWGEDGHGYLPYEYVLNGWACDIWTMVIPDCLDPEEFRHPAAEIG
jgi:C1A family cysteine protease